MPMTGGQMGDSTAQAAAVAAQAAVDAVEVKTDKLTSVADGLQLAAGESLLIPDGESVRPVNTEMATIGTTTKQFSAVNTAKTDYTP
jgi:hypothetical protein